MNSPARKQTISVSADCYTDETDQAMNRGGELELRTPAPYCDLPRRWHPRIIEGRVDRSAFRMPTLDEINRPAPDTSMFVLRLHDRFDVTIAIDTRVSKLSGPLCWHSRAAQARQTSTPALAVGIVYLLWNCSAILRCSDQRAVITGGKNGYRCARGGRHTLL
jgi:hypothetical protein